MKSYLIYLVLLCVFGFSACEVDGGDYRTINPPLDGVIIGGDPSKPEGYILGKFTGSICSNSTAGCLLALSNNKFITLIVPIPESLLNTLGQYAFSVKNADTTISYIYKRNGNYLERDRSSYTNGIYPELNYYNIAFLYNEEGSNILVRGVFPLAKSAWHAKNSIYAMMELKENITKGSPLSVCAGAWNKTTNSIDSPDCGEIQG